MIINCLKAATKGALTLIGLTLLSVAIPVVRILAGKRKAQRFAFQGVDGIARLLSFAPRWEGQFADEPALYLCNHPSYLDILFALNPTDSVLVAAHEFKNKPFIGWLGRALQTVWINRHCPHSRRSVRQVVVQKLREGTSVFVFPEGQTTGSHTVQAVKPGLFHSAVEEGLPLAFLSIRYHNPTPLYFHTMAPGFFRDWLNHAWRVLHQPAMEVTVKVGVPQRYSCPNQAQDAFYQFHNHQAQAA
jgi:1-acyl-sn-glycerol-3-phosphate acyltransferase